MAISEFWAFWHFSNGKLPLHPSASIAMIVIAGAKNPSVSFSDVIVITCKTIIYQKNKCLQSDLDNIGYLGAIIEPIKLTSFFL